LDEDKKYNWIMNKAFKLEEVGVAYLEEFCRDPEEFCPDLEQFCPDPEKFCPDPEEFCPGPLKCIKSLILKQIKIARKGGKGF
jgi:hypothetical protein